MDKPYTGDRGDRAERFLIDTVVFCLLAVMLVLLATVALSHAQEPNTRVSFEAGTVVGEDSLNAMGNTNVLLYTVVPDMVDLTVTMGGEIGNREGVENSAGFAAGPGVSLLGRSFTLSYVYRQKGNEWGGAVLMNERALDRFLGTSPAEVQPEPAASVDPHLRGLHATINRFPVRRL